MVHQPVRAQLPTDHDRRVIGILRDVRAAAAGRRPKPFHQRLVWSRDQQRPQHNLLQHPPLAPAQIK